MSTPDEDMSLDDDPRVVVGVCKPCSYTVLVAAATPEEARRLHDCPYCGQPITRGHQAAMDHILASLTPEQREKWEAARQRRAAGDFSYDPKRDG